KSLTRRNQKVAWIHQVGTVADADIDAFFPRHDEADASRDLIGHAGEAELEMDALASLGIPQFVDVSWEAAGSRDNIGVRFCLAVDDGERLRLRHGRASDRDQCRIGRRVPLLDGAYGLASPCLVRLYPKRAGLFTERRQA